MRWPITTNKHAKKQETQMYGNELEMVKMVDHREGVDDQI